MAVSLKSIALNVVLIAVAILAAARPAFALEPAAKDWRAFKTEFLANFQDLKTRDAWLGKIAEFDSDDAVELLFDCYASHYFDHNKQPLRSPAPKDVDYLDRYQEILGQYKSEKAVEAIVKSGIRSKVWYLQALAVDAIGRSGDPARLGPVHDLIADKKTDYFPLLSAIKAVRRIQDPSSLPVLAELAERETRWELQLRILYAFRDVETKQGIPVFIKLLACGNKRIRAEALRNLVEATGQNFHQNYQMWLNWYTENKTAIDDGTLVKGTKTLEPPLSSETYYGMPIDSDRVIFIIDSSGSMAEPYKVPGGEAVVSGEGDAHTPRGDTKLDIVKDELIHAITQLEENVQFTVIVYSSDVRPWKHKPVAASEANKKLAINYIKGLSPAGETNIYDAVESAILMAQGANATEGKFHAPVTGAGGALVDTIFLLSDGMPNAGRIPSPQNILPAVRILNATFEIKINTIFVGPSDNSFMKDLAEQNHGTYVRY